MMRLAVLSDIHGNLLALQAVLDDLKQAGGADRTWILGDLVTLGPRPAECLKVVRDLQSASPETVEVIGGNTDRYVVTGARRASKIEKEEDWIRLPERLREHLAYNLFAAERLNWEDAQYLMKLLRRELALEVPDYGWVIGFHGGPGNDEQNMLPDMPDDVLLDALYESEGRLAFCGHTHKPMDKDLGRWRLVNVGAVAFSGDGDQRASYALVNFEGNQATVELRRVAYDTEAMIGDLDAQNHPNARQITHFVRTNEEL